MIFAVDTGGTKTLVGAFDENGSLVSSVRFPTVTGVNQYIETVSNHLKQLSEGQPIDIVSLALPGIVRDGVAIWCRNLGWTEVPIRELLMAALPGSMVIVENDANLAGLASVKRLQTTPVSGLYITIGTGVGTALILNGSLHPALSQSEGGNMVLSHNGRLQTWEEFASGRAIYEAHGQLTAATSLSVWQDVADRISVGLCALIPFLQPEVIVIGGGLSTHTDFFKEHIAKSLDGSLAKPLLRPIIHKALHTEDAVLYGCYDYALSHSRTA